MTDLRIYLRLLFLTVMLLGWHSAVAAETATAAAVPAVQPVMATG